MRSAVLRWFDQAVAALRELMDRPWALFFVLLAVNAVALPYSGIVHDAQLYGAQVLNRVEDGAYADDLFFRYGSQDKYSLFSVVAAPVVRLFGLQTGFFLLYLVFSALMLLAVQRLLLTLIKDRIVVALSLLLLATAPLAYGGLDVFHVNERFVTPRLLAIALAAFGLDQMLKVRYKTTFVLLVLAGLMHPLMTCGAVLVFAGWWAVERLGWRRTLWIGAPLAVVAAAVLAYQPLGARVFGPMDDEWREYTRRAFPMNFPTEWNPLDWIHLGASFVFIVGLAIFHGKEDRRLARFALVVGAVSAVALVATLLASCLPYALLLQGQPYRALWLLRVLQAPFGLQLAADLWRRADGRGKLPAVGLAAYLGAACCTPVEFALIGFAALAAALMYYRALSSAPRRPDWLVQGLTAGLVFGVAACAALRFAAMLEVANQLLRLTSAVDFFSLMLGCLGAVGWAAVCLSAVLLGRRLLGLGWRFRLAAAGTWLIVQTAAFAVVAAGVWDVPVRPASDMQFVRRFLEGRRNGGRLPTIYCSVGEIGDVWLTAHAKSYFNRYQLAGNLFNRDTAVEGQRRALLVRRFETERFRRYLPFLPDEFKNNLEELYQAPLCDSAPPTRDDLATLCREEAVDYVVLGDAFDVPCADSNGRLYIYDCRQVRAALDGRLALDLPLIPSRKRISP